MNILARALAAVLLALSLGVPARADVNEVRITRQPGLLYLPLMIIEENHLLEKYAKQKGAGDIKVNWTTFNSGGAAVDALLSGNVDFVTSGATNMLVAWSATNGQVKGVAGAGALPMVLVTRNPKVKSIKDFTSADKIALPTVRVSSQATVLQLAAEKEFGPSETHKLDPLTVALGHPDAFAALQSGKGEIDSHFSLPPYQEEELRLPGVHAVTNSVEIAGGPISNGVVFSQEKFHDANPKIVAALVSALDEAMNLIRTNKRAAAQIYLDQSHEKLSVDDLVKMLSEPNWVYSTAPRQSLKLAQLMYRAGTIKKQASNWKEFFFPEVHNVPGGS